MEATLMHSIRYAVWHDVWTNRQQDDMVILLSRFLDWQAIFPHQQDPNRPFSGNSLFSLLLMGLMPHLSFPLPFDKKGKLTQMPQVLSSFQTAANMARQSASRLIEALSKSERESYGAFQKRYILAYAKEYERRCDPAP